MATQLTHTDDLYNEAQEELLSKFNNEQFLLTTGGLIVVRSNGKFVLWAS